jgi:hypothetical protein
MMNKGFQMMLQALGINIDPVEIENAFQRLRTDLPAWAEILRLKFESIDVRLSLIESSLVRMEAMLIEFEPIQAQRALLAPKKVVNGKSERIFDKSASGGTDRAG